MGQPLEFTHLRAAEEVVQVLVHQIGYPVAQDLLAIVKHPVTARLQVLPREDVALGCLMDRVGSWVFIMCVS